MIIYALFICLITKVYENEKRKGYIGRTNCTRVDENKYF